MSIPVAETLRAKLDERLAAHDRTGAVSDAVEAIESGELTVEQLYTRVLTPLLVDTGAGWQAGTTQIWQEHFATSTVRTIVEALNLHVAKAAQAVPRIGSVAVLACPPEESHDLGLRMLADRMTLRGWTTYFLGADTPVDQIVHAARELDANLVVMSAATHYNRVMLRQVVDQLKSALPGVRIGVGGPAFALDRHWPADELLSEAELGLGPGVELTGE